MHQSYTINIVQKVPKIREVSHKVILPRKPQGTKRMKVGESASNTTEVISDNSMKHQLASETYRKIKEVEYRRETIYDKNGMEISYNDNPQEYKKARKRMQNRESAIRSRTRKRQYFTELEVKYEKLAEENKSLVTENATLKVEKKLLSEQLEYFKNLVGNMQSGFSAKSTNERSREVSSENISFDEEKDSFQTPSFDPLDGELPHIGNYKRPLGNKQKDEEENEDRFVLSRNQDSSPTGTAGLFFLGVIMCIMCFTSLTLTGGGHDSNNKREFTVELPDRHLMELQKEHEERTSLLRITMWLLFFLSMGIAYFTRISVDQ